MSILLMMPNEKAKSLQEVLQKLTSVEVEIWPNQKENRDVTFCVTWNHLAGELLRFPNLKAISSYGAGVDHLLKDPKLPNVPICRVVDDLLAEDMSEFVLASILRHHCNLESYRTNQNDQIWEPRTKKKTSETHVGVMGLGKIGKKVAERIRDSRFRTLGFSRSKHEIAGVETFAEGGLSQFLSRLDILVCLLPLNKYTQNILNRELFKKMKKGSFLINVARGGHLNENDLIDALDKGILTGAALDVFQQEPLPKNHPFWGRRDIFISPHIASVTNPQAVAKQLVENYERSEKNLPLMNLVDPKRSY